MIETVHCGSNSILKVRFFGHRVFSIGSLNNAMCFKKFILMSNVFSLYFMNRKSPPLVICSGNLIRSFQSLDLETLLI